MGQMLSESIRINLSKTLGIKIYIYQVFIIENKRHLTLINSYHFIKKRSLDINISHNTIKKYIDKSIYFSAKHDKYFLFTYSTTDFNTIFNKVILFFTKKVGNKGV